jgi:hypothetical protein
MPSIDFETVKRFISVVKALGMWGWRGRVYWWPNHRGQCPLCAGTDPYRPPFWATEERWYCHKCKTGGDVIDLWRALHIMTWREAAVDLCRSTGLSVPYKQRSKN